MIGGIDELFNPGAARAREEMAREHEMALPAPDAWRQAADGGAPDDPAETRG